MQTDKCPKCGHDTATDSACPGCGQPAVNGVAKPMRRDPPPPPELAGVVFERSTPEMIEDARRTFDEAEYWTAFRETEETGGVDIDGLIAEMEQQVHGTD